MASHLKNLDNLEESKFWWRVIEILQISSFFVGVSELFPGFSILKEAELQKQKRCIYWLKEKMW